MTRLDLSDRLVYWTEPHPAWKPNPEWPEDVGCVLYAATVASVLVDPLVRDDLDPRAWGWLDERVEAAGLPVVVLLTAPWHARSTARIAERYGAAVHPAPLPSGIERFVPRGVDEGQAAFFLEPERTLVVGEFFAGTGEGLRVCPSPATSDADEFIRSLRELELLPIERVLVGHGPPVLERGSDAIAAALAAEESR